jgi:hypothetical protein
MTFNRMKELSEDVRNEIIFFVLTIFEKKFVNIVCFVIFNFYQINVIASSLKESDIVELSDDKTQ